MLENNYSQKVLIRNLLEKKVQKGISGSDKLKLVFAMLMLLVRSPLEHLFYFYFFLLLFQL